MKRRSKAFRWIFLLLACLIIAPVFTTGAFALSVSKTDPFLYADLSKAQFQFDFTPQANGDYALFLFSQDGGEVSARALLLKDGETVLSGEGSGKLFSGRLAEGAKYTVRVEGKGKAVIEMVRDRNNRSYEKPKLVGEGAAPDKAIAQSFDAHWYRFNAAETGRMLLFAVPANAALNLRAYLFDDGGALISRFDSLDGGACMLISHTEAGRDYYLRISAPDGGTGNYNLYLNRSVSGAIASALSFDEEAYTLSEGHRLSLAGHVHGEAMLWASDNSAVASVDQQGKVSGHAEGSAVITVYGVNSQASCRVNVEYVKMEGLDIIADKITLAEGDIASITVDFIPHNTSETNIGYSLDSPSIAEVTVDGALIGKKAGRTTLHVFSEDGSISDSVEIVITPRIPRYGALLVNEENYPSYKEDGVRQGSRVSAEGLKALLESSEIEGAKYDVSLKSDIGRIDLFSAIREKFKDAASQDISLIYISSHGWYTGGMTFLELTDGSFVSVRDLERELRRIPGTIVVLIDCCYSGGAIGKASDYADFSKNIISTFANAPVNGSKYKVICSAGLDQKSHRGKVGDMQGSLWQTEFIRALCKGAGWDIAENRMVSMAADANMDQKVSFGELTAYMPVWMDKSLGIMGELDGKLYRQDIQFYPAGDPLILADHSRKIGG